MGTRGTRRVVRFVWPALALVLIATGLVLAWVSLAAAPATAGSRALQAGESYGRQEVVWSQGPSIQTRRVVPVSGLAAALASAVPPTTRQSVDTVSLERRYGPQRQIAMIVLRGTYNSLPPDEGVNISGDVVVLVDVTTKRILLLTS